MTAGRPSDYPSRQEDVTKLCNLVVDCGKKGFSVTEIACEIGVVKQTLYSWSEKHKEFMDALTRARQESQAWFERVGRENLTAERFQSSLWSKQVSCRFPDDYREKQGIEHSGILGIRKTELTDDELASIATSGSAGASKQTKGS